MIKPYRRPLPMRRRCETFELPFGGLTKGHVVTVGFYADDTPGEVFINGGRSGEQVEAIARDGAIMVSMLLQYGVPLENVRSAITRTENGEPLSIVGAVVDRLTEAEQ